MPAVCFSTSAVLCLETEEFVTPVRRPSAHKRANFKVKRTFYPHHFQSLVNESCYAKNQKAFSELSGSDLLGNHRNDFNLLL